MLPLLAAIGSLPVIVCCDDIANRQRSYKSRRRSESEASQIHNPRSALAGGAAPTQHAHNDGFPGGPPGFAGPPVPEVGLELQELDPPVRLPVGQDALHAIMDIGMTSRARHKRSRTRHGNDS